MASRKKNYNTKQVIENLELWQSLTKEEQEYLESNIEFINYKKNSIIYSDGEEPTKLLGVLNGFVKINKEGVGVRSQIVRIIKPNELFGYRAMFAGEKYITTAYAVEATTIFAIPKEVITKLLSENAKLAFEFIRFLSIDLGISDSRGIVLTQKHLRGRLAETILHLKENYGTLEDGATLVLNLSREDMASLSNMTTSNAIRTLSQFSTDGLVSVNGRSIKILELELLQRIAKYE
jgi:CRP-like cAMP-binding protein